MGHVFQADFQMRHWAGGDEFFGHICLKRQLLHIGIVAQADKTFPVFIGFVIGVLHDAQHFEHGAMLFHKHFAGNLQILGPA